MSDREERQHVIKVLQEMVDWMELTHYIVAKPERIHALGYAINSIKTDLKYDLLYEETSGHADKQADKPTTKNDLSSELDKNSKKLEKNFGESDCISREQALRELKESAEHHANDSREEVLLRRDRDIIRALPPVTPIRPKGHWIPIYQGDEIINYRCSECEFGNTFGKGTFGMNFCTRCGSDNREVKE